MRSSLFAASVVLAAVATPVGVARAQQQRTGGFALDRFDPAPVGDVFFGVPSPDAPGHLSPRVALVFDDAEQPIHSSPETGDLALVERQAFLRLGASIGLWDRVLLSADVPLAVSQTGDRPAGTNIQYPELGAPEMGDLRLGARVRLFGEDGGPLQLGVGAYVFAPTGSPSQYTGEGTTRAAFHASAGGRTGERLGFVWSAGAGFVSGSDYSPGRATFGAGAAVLLAADLLQLGCELYGSAPLGHDPKLTFASVPLSEDDATLHTELLFGAKLRVLGGLTFGAAAGPGLFDAIATPEVRVIGLAGWAPLPHPAVAAAGSSPEPASTRDRDDDGIRDTLDACPDVKGEPSVDPQRDGCPPSDRDGDAVLDIDDACPAAAGIQSPDPTKNGCPSDSDGDGVHDGIDACPDRPGPKVDNSARNGCPPDADDDGIADADDACPKTAGPASPIAKQNGCPEDPDGDSILRDNDACPLEKGPPSNDPGQNGCPRFVRVTANEIITSKPVQFLVYGKTRSQTVDPISNDILFEVRDVLAQHPEIERVEVQGHTDDSGDDAFNQTLSEERASAVREWLVAAGVPPEKLVAKGYGYERPLSDNRIRKGRQRNRRVQFFILQRQSK